MDPGEKTDSGWLVLPIKKSRIKSYTGSKSLGSEPSAEKLV